MAEEVETRTWWLRLIFEDEEEEEEEEEVGTGMGGPSSCLRSLKFRMDFSKPPRRQR